MIMDGDDQNQDATDAPADGGMGSDAPAGDAPVGGSDAPAGDAPVGGGDAPVGEVPPPPPAADAGGEGDSNPTS